MDMKRISSIVFPALLILATAAVGFGQKSPASALLYKVSGKGLTKPSYILGTFHAICPTDMVPIEKLAGYLGETEQLYLELDLDDPAIMFSMAQALQLPAGKNLKELYTEEQYLKVGGLLKDSVGLPIDAVKSIRPSMLAVMVITSPKLAGCKPAAVDTLIMKAATDSKKPVYGLETVEAQIAALNSQPLEKQASDLLKIAEDPQRSVNELKELMATYRSQDSDKLFAITAKEMDKEGNFRKRLLDDRNLDWMPKIQKNMAEKPTFFAVGAGHLGGKNGVIALLKAKGYKLTPIRF
jgi:uncharacterized protein YbaP (TraB family)